MNASHQDPVLNSYIQTLRTQSKFKAKISYTLSCINNYLSPSSSSVRPENVSMLCCHHSLFVDLLQQHPDASILQQLSILFSNLQKYVTNSDQIMISFLDSVLAIERMPTLSEACNQNLSQIISQLDQPYKKTKQFCLKLIQSSKVNNLSGEANTDQSIRRLIQNIVQYDDFNVSDAIEVKKSGVGVQIVLELLWTALLRKNQDVNQIELALQEYLKEQMWAYEIVYKCAAVAVVYNVDQQGTIQKLKSPFLNQFLRNPQKPIHPNSPQNKKSLAEALPQILSKIGYISTNILIQQLPYLKQKQNRQLEKLYSEIKQRKQISVNLLQKYGDFIPLQMLSLEGAGKNIFERRIRDSQVDVDTATKVLVRVFAKIKNGGGFSGDKVQWSVCLSLLKIAINNKDHPNLWQIQKIIPLIPITTQQIHELIKQSPSYILLLPSLFPTSTPPSSLLSLSTAYLTSQSQPLTYKFYLAASLIKWKQTKSTHNFLNFLLRILGYKRLPYQQMAYYLKHRQWNQGDIQWMENNFSEELERILEKVMAKLVDYQCQGAKDIIFAIEKFGVFGTWSSVYRWMLNPLDQPDFHHPQYLIDNLELFEVVVEKCENIPIQLTKKFFGIVAKNWQNYKHDHMFAIQRIGNTLFSQQLPNNELQHLTNYFQNLPSQTWPHPTLHQTSLHLLLSSIQLTETQNLIIQLQQQIKCHLLTVCKQKQPFKQLIKLKNTLFCTQVLLWNNQYNQDIVDKEVIGALVAVLARIRELEFGDFRMREKFVEAVVQVVATVPHQYNLLQLNLYDIISIFPHNAKILASTTQILHNIKQSNIKAISKFKLHPLIPILTSYLLTCTDEKSKPICNLLGQLTLPKQSPYYPCIAKQHFLISQLFRVQVFCVNGFYRQEIMIFAVQWAREIGLVLEDEWGMVIGVKYGGCKQVVEWLCEQGLNGGLKDNESSCLEKYISNKQKEDRLSKQKAQKQREKQVERQKQRERERQRKRQQEREQKKMKQERSAKLNLKQGMGQKSEIQQRDNDLVDNSKNKLIVSTVSQAVIQPKQKTQPKSLGLNIQNIQQQPVAAYSQPKLSSTKTSSGFPSGFSSANTQKKRKPKLNEQQVQNMNTIRGHIAYVDSLAGVTVTEEQINKLLQSLNYLSQVVTLHNYYVQKVVNLGVVGKVLALTDGAMAAVLADVLDLFQCISQNKDKNLVLFNDAKSLQFFKLTLKPSLVSKQPLPTTTQIIKIMQHSWSSSTQFFTSGLLSILFELCKLSLNRIQILTLLTECELSYQIISQIYLRGLFALMQKLLETQNSQLRQEDKKQISLWAKLMAKVCFNQSIREKVFSLGLHEKVWSKKDVLQELGTVHNLADFYASFCHQFNKACNWMIEQKVPEYLISQMQKQSHPIPLQYIRFLRHFSYVQPHYLMRLQVGQLLLKLLPEIELNIAHESYKHYFKCLSHLILPENYDYFLKNEVVALIIRKFQELHSFYFIQCLAVLVSRLKNVDETDVLIKQGLLQLNTIFNSKLKDDLCYPHLIQVYINMLKKFKRVDKRCINMDLSNKIIRKAIFSINMEGKKKTLQFLIELSNIDKQYHGNANCSRLFQLLLSYNINEDELNLLQSYLQIESKYKFPIRQSEQARVDEQQKYPLRFKKIVEIPCKNLLESLLNKFQQLYKESAQISGPALQKPKALLIRILKILKFFNNNQDNSVFIYDSIGSLLLQASFNICPVGSGLQIIDQLLNWKPVQGRIKMLGEQVMMNYIKQTSFQIAKNPNSSTTQLYSKVIQKCLKNLLISQSSTSTFLKSKLPSQIQQQKSIKSLQSMAAEFKQKPSLSAESRSAMLQGIKVRMHKVDGSISNLILLFTSDLIQLNCVTTIGEPVKSKWKLPLIQIDRIVQYHDQKIFKESVFFLEEGIFSKAPSMELCLSVFGKGRSLHIEFESRSQLEVWKIYIEQAKAITNETFKKVSY